MDKKIKRNIVFLSHLGLGDNISCNGIVHYLAEKYDQDIFVACKHRNLKNISFLYKDFDFIHPVTVDNDPTFEVQTVQQLAIDNDLELVRTSLSVPNDKPWDADFYRQLGLDYNIKFDYARLPIIPNEKQVLASVLKKYRIKKRQDFAFVHNDSQRGFTFKAKTSLPEIPNQPDLNVFEMSCILKKATELHMMGSSLICVAEVLKLPLSHQRAFFYDIRSGADGTINISNKENWKYYG